MGRLSVWLVAAALLVVSNSARADVVITVDKNTQRMHVSVDGQPLYNWPVSTGKSGYATPSGSFTAFRMEADHRSDEWDDAPMPHSIFFTKQGHAIHGSFDAKNIGRPASHGCVRLSTANAARLFALVEREGVLKTRVILTGSEQVALARRGIDNRASREVYDTRAPDYFYSNTDEMPPGYGQGRYPNPSYSYGRPQYVEPQYAQPRYIQPQYRQPAYRDPRAEGIY